MKKQYILTLYILTIATISACNDDIQLKNRSFKDLCEMSGGVLSTEGYEKNICKCDDKKCPTGVVCINTDDGKVCAGTSTIINGGNCQEWEQNKSQCVNNEKGIGQTISCEASSDGTYKWKFANTESEQEYNCGTNSCETNEKCGECLNYDVKCENGIQYICETGKWTHLLDCETKTCANSQTCGDCINGYTKCENGKKAICINGIWSKEIETCLTGSCDPNPKDNNYQTCSTCIEGAVQCQTDDQNIGHETICNDSQWVTPQMCSDGKRCKEDADCNDGSECKEIVACNNSYSCTAPELSVSNGYHYYASSCGVCINEQVKCEDGVRYICESGSWKVLLHCQYGVCADNQRECLKYECENATTKCEDGKLYTCTENSWGNGVGCDGEVSCKDSTSCGECATGSAKCEKDTRYACINGNWITMEVCNIGCADDKLACIEPKCTEGAKKCEDGKMYTCTNNGWAVTEECGENSCHNDACGVCKNGAIMCESGIQSTCDNGEWKVIQTCTLGCQEDNIHCVAPECQEGSQKCDNGQEFTCINGKWDNATQCTFGSCRDSVNCGECQNDEVECLDGAWRKCTTGKWSNYVTCPNNNECTSYEEDEKTKTKCGICNATTKQVCYDERGLAICKNGEWQFDEDSKCTSNQVCLDGNCIESNCKAPDIKCVDNPGTNIGSKWTCQQGIHSRWSISECTNGDGSGRSCNKSNTECGECLNGSPATYKNNELDVCVRTSCKDGELINDIDPNGNSCKYEGGKGVDFGECKNGNEFYQNNSTGKCVHYSCLDGQAKIIDKSETGSCKVVDGNITGFGECINGQNLGCTNFDAPIHGNYAGFIKCVDGQTPNYETLKDLTDVELSKYIEIKCGEKSCDATGTRCVACNEGQKKCVDSVKNGKEIGQTFVCDSENWAEVSCNYSCHNDVCGACINGEKRCASGVVEECVQGEFISTNTHCNSCVPGYLKCKNDANNVAFQCLESGDWDGSETHVDTVYGINDCKTVCTDFINGCDAKYFEQN